MPRYFFELRNGGPGCPDHIGSEFPHDRAAVEHGYAVAREMTNHYSLHRASFCIWIRDESGNVLFKLPFADVNDRIALLPPEQRILVQQWFELHRGIADALFDARQTVLQSRALMARASRRPYLAAEGGRSVL